MSFSRQILAELCETDVIQSAKDFSLHALGPELLELSVKESPRSPRLLLTRDAAIDLAFRLADFLARLEAREEKHRRERA